MRPAGLAVTVRQRRGGRAAGVGGALLVPGAPLLAGVERAADPASGEVGSVRHGRAADVVGRRGGDGRPLRRPTAAEGKSGGTDGKGEATEEEEVAKIWGVNIFEGLNKNGGVMRTV